VGGENGGDSRTTKCSTRLSVLCRGARVPGGCPPQPAPETAAYLVVSSNRDMVLELRDRMSAMSSLPPSQGSAAAPPVAAPKPNGEAEDAAWIVELRPGLVRWL